MSKENRVPRGGTPFAVREAIAALGEDASNADLARWIQENLGFIISESQISRNKPKPLSEEPSPDDLKLVHRHFVGALKAVMLLDEMGEQRLRKAVDFWIEHEKERKKQASNPSGEETPELTPQKVNETKRHDSLEETKEHNPTK